MADLNPRVVAITGGARGIGRAIATELARAGARVGIGDVDLEAARAAADAIGGGAEAFEVDVTDRASVERFLDGVEERLGPLDVMVNNAGILLVGPFLEEDDAATQRQLAVNVMGVVHGMRAALPRMLGRGRGHVVNIASSASWAAPPGEVTYSATKHAVLALTDGVREELEGSGIHLTGVYPGLVDTELARGTKPPRGSRWISPDDVARVVVRAIRDPRPDVFVPREFALTTRLARMLPTRGRQRLMRALDVNRVTDTTDPGERADYMKRIGLDPEAAGRGTGGEGAAAGDPAPAGRDG
jgi:NAD(P)-dependent dehydrogenase (short-subunit alcohol dehydrogenase family)